MRLTPEILQALNAAIEAAGGVRAFGRKGGLSGANVSRYKNRKITDIDPRTWRDLEPHLRPFFPKDSPLRASAPITSTAPVSDVREELNKQLDRCSISQLSRALVFVEDMLAGAAPPQESGLSQEEGATENVG